MAKEGDTVFPGQPVALTGTFDTASNTHLSFTVSYLIEENFEKGQPSTFASFKHHYAFVDPVFWKGDGISKLSPGGEYIADFTNENITKEMTKREKKKWEDRNR